MAQSLKRASIAAPCCKKESHRNGGGMPLRLKRQREKYVANPNSVYGNVPLKPRGAGNVTIDYPFCVWNSWTDL